MAVTILGNEVATNGTTPVDVIPAPGASEVHVAPASSVGCHNLDDVVHTIIWRKLKGATATIIQSDAAVAVGGRSILTKKVALDATDEKLQVLFGEAQNGATAPRADALYLLVTP
jgi:hypothetical protein